MIVVGTNESRTGIRLSRRTFIAWAAGATALTLLQACAPAAAPAPTTVPPAPTKAPVVAPTPAPTLAPTAKPAAPKPKVVVQMWYYVPGKQAEHVEKMAANFTKEFPHIEVQMLVVPAVDLSTKLATAVAAGTPPDIPFMGGTVLCNQMMDAEKLVPLDKFRPDLATLDWLEPLKKSLVREGHMYAVPVHSGTLGVYYNRERYKEAGLDPDKPPATWDDLVRYAKAIAKPDKAIWGHYIVTKPTWHSGATWIAYLWQAGGEWLSPDESEVAFNSAAGVEALQFYVDLVHKHKVTPLKSIDGVIAGTDFETGNVGHITLYTDWLARLAALKFRAGTAKLPRHKVEVTILGSNSIAMFKDAKHKEEAWTFLDWLMKPANAIEFVKGLGNLPTRHSIRESPAFKEVLKENPLLAPFAEAQPTARLAYDGPGGVEMFQQAALGIEVAVFGQKTPKQALDEAAKEANEILKRERAKVKKM
ncbi:MAG: ABC transporter substrate-binding protein [Chloroflexi bacterium]|nr:ABC transporter substrate-binding protein [Chloroflexota bacterium]